MIIKFELKVPDWANYTTVDRCGVMEAWEKKPETSLIEGRWRFGGRRKQIFQLDSDSCRDWKKSLKAAAGVPF